MHTNLKTTVIRCDDIFVDSDPKQFKEICQIIGQYDFDHLIGITPLGEGKKLWTSSPKVLKLALSAYGAFTNRYLLKLTGEKHVENNAQLVQVLKTEFSENGAISAIHGLHHYKYTKLTPNKVREELSEGIDLFNTLFNIRVKVFIPPFNAWNRRTELICENLGLTLDKCSMGFDLGLDEMKNSQIIQLAKQQCSASEVHYHPYRISNLEKFELYLKTRKSYY